MELSFFLLLGMKKEENKIGFLSNVIRIQSTKYVIDKLTLCAFASEPVGVGWGALGRGIISRARSQCKFE